MSSVMVRPGQARDSETLREIYNWAVTNTTATMDTMPRTPEEQRVWMEAHDGNPYPLLVAESWDEPGRVVGYACLSSYNRKPGYRITAEVSLYVHPDWHGLGIGKSLLLALSNEAARRGFVSLVSLITADNTVSLRLHSSCGFVEVGTLRQVAMKFDRRIDVVFLQKFLNDNP